MNTAEEHNHAEGVPRLPSQKPAVISDQPGQPVLGHAAPTKSEKVKFFEEMMTGMGIKFVDCTPAIIHDERKFLRKRQPKRTRAKPP
jgi:hypothetical protein